MPTVTDWSQAPEEDKAAPATQTQQKEHTAGKVKLVNGQLPPQEVIVEDMAKKVITYTRIDDKKAEKKTAYFKTEIRKAAANSKILERRKWKKFGDSAGLPPGPDSGVTTISDDVYLSLKVRAPGAVEAPEENTKIKDLMPGKGIVQCRICKGGHWTKECPHKNDAALVKAMLPQDQDDPLPSEAAKAEGGKPGVYTAPGRRGPAGAGSSMDTRDDTATVRVSNISENTREDDLRELFRGFGPLQRCFLATDKDTGLARGFAYINFFRKEDAAKAIEKLNGHGYDHLILQVEWAKPQPEK